MRLAATALLTTFAPAAATAQAFDGTRCVDTFTGPVVSPLTLGFWTRLGPSAPASSVAPNRS